MAKPRRGNPTWLPKSGGPHGEATAKRRPNDEPASARLKRIRADRVGATLRGHPQSRGTGQPHRVAPTTPYTSNLPELPDGWTWTTVRQIAKSIQYGYTSKSSDDINGPHYLRITDIQSGKVDWTSVPRCEIAKDDVPKYLLKPGDIVFARSGATAGKSYLIKELPESVFASYLIRVQTSPEVLPDYLYAFFNSKDYWDNLATRGNAQPNANAQVLGNVTLPLPPLSEQRRIVARIESLFAESRSARHALERVPALLKRFRQSILASAFRGNLTERDPNDEPASVLLKSIRAERVGATLRGRLQSRGTGQPHRVAPTTPDTSDLPKLPEGWVWTTLGDMLTFIGSGITPRGGEKVYTDSGIPFIRSQNVYPDGLRLENVAHVSPKLHTDMSRTYLQANDVLLNITGASIGRSTVVPTSLGQANVNQHVCIITHIQV